MKNQLQHHKFAYCALIFWLLASLSGMHGHFCFDGKEAPISVHIDVMAEHPEHHADEHHIDADVDILKLVLAKLVKIDVPLLLTVALMLMALCAQQNLFFARYSRYSPRRILGLRPPLRAPPFFPA